MKISYNWLKSYLDFHNTPEEISIILTQCGLEVESLELFESVKGGLKGVVTGEVIQCEKHPNADKLSITKVNIGADRLLSIVCGAPNVKAGQKVLVATLGTTLWFGDKPLEIKAAKIRGEASEGMICAEDELGLGTSHEGILVLPSDTQLGISASEVFELVTDYIFEIGLTPNRADATSHLGVARDLAAAINAAENTGIKVCTPTTESFSFDNQSLPVEVIVEDAEACPRYSGISVGNIHVGESPAWLKNRLLAVGLRPINNVVDITNFVLMECGQPLHAFDLKAVKGNKVVVRKPLAGTKFISLDGVERKLSGRDLMICNETEGMCIAGVFGGLNSGVSADTKAIFLESAYFNPVSVRQTSKFHTLKTDASFRYERGADPNVTVYALYRALALMKEICGAETCSNIIDVYPTPIKNAEVTFRYDRMKKLVGKEIPSKKIRSILIDLGFDIIAENETDLRLIVPASKVDVTREIDVIEEVLRIYGYNNVEISAQMISSIGLKPTPDHETYRETIADFLSSKGFYETMNVSLANSELNKRFVPEKAGSSVNLLNPLSRELDSMRQSLVFDALENVVYNTNRKQSSLKLFEFGKIYEINMAGAKDILSRYTETRMLSLCVSGRKFLENWNTNTVPTDVFDLRGVLSAVMKRVGIDIYAFESEQFSSSIFSVALRATINDKVLYEFGTIAKDLLKAYDIKQDVFVGLVNWDLLISRAENKVVRFAGLPKFPEVKRDLALVIDTHVHYEQIRAQVLKSGGEKVKSVQLFDVYEGEKIPEGKKSYAISIMLGDHHKTLTDNEIEGLMSKIYKALNATLGATLR